MTGLILTIAPIFVIVVIGNLLRRAGLPGDGFWPLAEKLGYWILIPSLLFHKLSTSEIRVDLMAPFALTLVGAFYIVGAVVLLVTGLMRMPAPQRGSTLQGAVRHNGFLALAVAETLYGAPGLQMAALAAAMLALATNLSIVPALLTLNAAGVGGSVLRRVLKDLARNPFIIAICLGLSASFLLPHHIPVLHDVTAMLGGVALPLMLLCVGAGLRLRGLKAQVAPLAIATAGRYVLFPLCVLLLPNGLAPEEMAILLIFAAVPTAPSSTALAGQTGGDVPLMNAIVTGQTALAFLTLPLTLAIGAAVLGM